MKKMALRTLKGWLWWLAGAFVCFIFYICLLAPMTKFMLVRIFVGLSGILLTNGLYFNYALNWAGADRNAVRFHGAKADRFMSVKMAFLGPLLQYLMWFILFLSKIGLIPCTYNIGGADIDILSIYMFCNIQCVTWVDLFTEQRNLAAVTAAGMAGLLFIVIISSVTIFITYECVYREIDVKALLMYGKKK